MAPLPPSSEWMGEMAAVPSSIINHHHLFNNRFILMPLLLVPCHQLR